MAAIIKILTALINDISRATRDILVRLPTLCHSMKAGRLRTSLSRSTRTDEAKNHQALAEQAAQHVLEHLWNALSIVH
jgi:hypothetical protein